MKILIVTNEYNKVKKVAQESDHEVIGCMRTYHFMKMVEEESPDVILSDGKCKRRDEYGQSVPCFFKPEKELSGTDIQAPVFPILGWKIWLKIVEIHKKIIPPYPN